jgi:hypothetical protein
MSLSNVLIDCLVLAMIAGRPPPMTKKGGILHSPLLRRPLSDEGRT